MTSSDLGASAPPTNDMDDDDDDVIVVEPEVKKKIVPPLHASSMFSAKSQEQLLNEYGKTPPNQLTKAFAGEFQPLVRF